MMYHVFDDKVIIECWKNQDVTNILHPAWQNMVDSIDDNIPHKEYENAIDRIMQKYHAKMIRCKTAPHYMRFPNEKMAMMFLLEWS